MTILPSTNPAAWSLDDAGTLMKNVTDLALTIAAGIAIIYLILGAINYFTAFGNEEKAGTAKKTITWAIVGLIVILLGKVFIGEIWRFISGTNPPGL